RSAAPAKSARRRSPDPGVVRAAAFVTPTRYAGSSNCSDGSSTRGVKPAAWRRRQKSLRGFAKWAWAAAETRPGLIPQKSTRRSGPKTSGIADPGCFGLGELVRVTRIEIFLEAAPQCLALDRQHVTRPARLELDDLDGWLPAAVAARVALRFAQTTQPSHCRRVRRTPDGSCHQSQRVSLRHHPRPCRPRHG